MSIDEQWEWEGKLVGNCLCWEGKRNRFWPGFPASLSRFPLVRSRLERWRNLWIDLHRCLFPASFLVSASYLSEFCNSAAEVRCEIGLRSENVVDKKTVAASASELIARVSEWARWASRIKMSRKLAFAANSLRHTSTYSTDSCIYLLRAKLRVCWLYSDSPPNPVHRTDLTILYTYSEIHFAVIARAPGVTCARGLLLVLCRGPFDWRQSQELLPAISKWGDICVKERDRRETALFFFRYAEVTKL